MSILRLSIHAPTLWDFFNLRHNTFTRIVFHLITYASVSKSGYFLDLCFQFMDISKYLQKPESVVLNGNCKTWGAYESWHRITKGYTIHSWGKGRNISNRNSDNDDSLRFFLKHRVIVLYLFLIESEEQSHQNEINHISSDCLMNCRKCQRKSCKFPENWTLPGEIWHLLGDNCKRKYSLPWVNSNFFFFLQKAEGNIICGFWHVISLEGLVFYRSAHSYLIYMSR